MLARTSIPKAVVATVWCQPPVLASPSSPIPSHSGLAFSGRNSSCEEPHQNAVIRLERVRDNPSTYTNANSTTRCGGNTDAALNTMVPSDFWPNTLFDAREGTLRDVAPAAPNASDPALNGVMHYIELDAGNLARWFGGQIGTTGRPPRTPLTPPITLSFISPTVAATTCRPRLGQALASVVAHQK